MQKIILKKNGIFFSFWDESLATWADRDIIGENLPLSWYLPYSVQIDGQLTIKDMLSILEPYRDEIQTIFTNSLAGLKLLDIYEVLKKEPIIITSVPMNCIYLFKIGEVSPIKDEELSFLSVYPTMMGVAINNDSDEELVYHLSSYDINSWCNLPFEIDYFIEYTDITDEEIVLDGSVKWMLFEIIHVLFSQISTSMKVTKSLSAKDESKLQSGPMLIEELFSWLEELDRILLTK